MMIVKAVYIGNSREAFIERGFTKGMNIIFSDDNHVGKSVVIQGLMYALGSDPLFSSTLNYKEYYFAADVEIDGEEFSILRQRDAFAVKRGSELLPFDTVSEFKRYWNSSVFKLPSIILNGEDHVVHLSLYNQMYFVPQSEKSSSQIMNPGLYRKSDFVEMIYAIGGLSGRSLPEYEEEALKAQRVELKALRKRLIRKAKAFNISDPALSVISPVADRTSRMEAIKAFEKLTSEITELRKSRNRLYGRMKKNEATLKELRSLNKSISVGMLKCLDCGSGQVGLELADSKMVFDVTTAELRSQIQSSIGSKVESYREEIASVDARIKRVQSNLSALMEEKDIAIEDVILYRDDYRELSVVDTELSEAESRLGEIDSILKSNRTQDCDLQERRDAFMNDIFEKMNRAHDLLCLGEDHAEYAGLFTTATEAYSGSELTEFVLSKAYALAVCLHHGCPIVVDSFRAEDLSTTREKRALKLFGGLSNQVIFTTTIKDEEHDKYESYDYVNAINYSNFETNKILQPEYLEEFCSVMKGFGVVV